MSKKRQETSGDDKPIYKKWWFWVLAVVVLGLIGLAMPDSETEENVPEEVGTELSEEEQRRREEEAAREALLPSEASTIGICLETLRRQYPYGAETSGTFLVFAPSSQTSRMWKIDVIITNAFNAQRKALMECDVEKVGEDIRIKYFNISN